MGGTVRCQTCRAVPTFLYYDSELSGDLGPRLVLARDPVRTPNRVARPTRNEAQIPAQPWKPTVSEGKPLGYAEIDAASRLAPDAEEWVPFIKTVLRLEPWMVLAVQDSIKQHRWRGSANPIGYIRTATMRGALRMGLHQR
jgi:hypothetical protein